MFSHLNRLCAIHKCTYLPDSHITSDEINVHISCIHVNWNPGILKVSIYTSTQTLVGFFFVRRDLSIKRVGLQESWCERHTVWSDCLEAGGWPILPGWSVWLQFANILFVVH